MDICQCLQSYIHLLKQKRLRVNEADLDSVRATRLGNKQWHEIKGFVHSDVLGQGISDATKSERHQFQEKRNEVPTAVNETPVYLVLIQISKNAAVPDRAMEIESTFSGTLSPETGAISYSLSSIGSIFK